MFGELKCVASRPLLKNILVRLNEMLFSKFSLLSRQLASFFPIINNFG
jgi:hypothetical protein